MSTSNPAAPTASVVVLMATHNGRRFIDEQVRSILDQRDVTVRLVISDDGSTDGTRDYLAKLTASDARVTVLPEAAPSGSAAGNFYRLLRDVEPAEGELIAFADQDDLWMPDKLERHHRTLTAGGFDGLSSNVTAFDANSRVLIKKDYPQRALDFLLESPGPGSTFLFTPAVRDLTLTALDAPEASVVEYHDWLMYAVARAAGLRWHIDGVSSVDYRQHDDNVMGSNTSVSSGLSRLALIRQRWHRGQSTALAHICLPLAAPEMHVELTRMLPLLESGSPRARFALARHSGALRRRPRDQRIIGLLIATGVW